MTNSSMELVWECIGPAATRHGADSVGAYSPVGDLSWDSIVVRFYGNGASVGRSLADCSRSIRMAVWSCVFGHDPAYADAASAPNGWPSVQV